MILDTNFDEYFKFITKIDDNTWYIQHDKATVCDSFYFHVLPNNRGVLMYGDYDVCYIEPSSHENDVVAWLSKCDYIGYFAEKVSVATSSTLKIQDFYNDKFVEDLAKFLADYADCIDDKFNVEDILEEAEHIDTQYDAIAFLQGYDIYDEYEMGIDYTHCFKLQHRCMVWFANKLKEESK